MEPLRVYDPPECDAEGAPLDWERCRTCNGVGSFPEEDAGGDQWRETCETCDGHRSLKAAALAAIAHGHPGGEFSTQGYTLEGMTVRCEDCGHPMGVGTWEAPGVEGALAESWLRAALAHLRAKHEEMPVAHWSPCDGGCHHRPLTDCRAVHDGEAHPYAEWSWDNGYSTLPREASWRQVDVRTLGEPHDLRPEKLAILCLRCFAERTPDA